MNFRRQTDIPAPQTTLHTDPETSLTIRNGSASKSQLKIIVPAVQNRNGVELYSTVEDFSKVINGNKKMSLPYDTLEHSNEMIFWLNDDFSLVSANLAFCTILGYTKEDLKQLHASDFLIDFDRTYQHNHFDYG